MDELSNSFIVDTTDASIVTKSLIRLLNAVIFEPSLKLLSGGLRSKLLALHSNSVEDFTQFLVEIYSGFLMKNHEADDTEENVEIVPNKFSMWTELIDDISTFIQTNNANLKDLYKNSTNTEVLKVFCQYLYWPLSLTLSKTETQVSSCFEFFFC